MLAERGRPEDLERLAAMGHVFDLKVDGIRALVRVAAGAVTMRSRNDADLTTRFPELVAAVAELEDAPLTLDAEVAVPGPDGFPSWSLTQRRTAQRAAPGSLAVELPATLYVFDLLEVRSRCIASWPYWRRREALETLTNGQQRRLCPTICTPDPWPLWQAVTANSLEGVIAKRRDSRYHAGRSSDWIKIKATHTLSCLVGGVEWSGAPEGVGEPRSLHLYLVGADGALVRVGKASAGVSAPMRHLLRQGLQHPPVVVEVEYSELTSAGVLRHPVVRAVRLDVDVLACGTDQLRSPS